MKENKKITKKIALFQIKLSIFQKKKSSFKKNVFLPKEKYSSLRSLTVNYTKVFFKQQTPKLQQQPYLLIYIFKLI